MSDVEKQAAVRGNRYRFTPEEDADILRWSKNPRDATGTYHWLTERASERAMELTFHQIAEDYRSSEKGKRENTFYTVAIHLITQAKKSNGVYGEVCSYRGLDGCKCSIGVLIPDEKYSPLLETRSVNCAGILDLISDEFTKDTKFLIGLQRIHDAFRVEAWPYRLEEFAFNNGIKCPNWLVSESPQGTEYFGMSFIRQAQRKLAEAHAEGEREFKELMAQRDARDEAYIKLVEDYCKRENAE